MNKNECMNIKSVLLLIILYVLIVITNYISNSYIEV